MRRNRQTSAHGEIFFGPPQYSNGPAIPGRLYCLYRPLVPSAQPGVEAEAAGTTGKQEEDAAQNRHVLVEITILGPARGRIGEVPIAMAAERRHQHKYDHHQSGVTGREPEHQGEAAEELRRHRYVGQKSREPAGGKRSGDGGDIEDLSVSTAHENPAEKDTTDQQRDVGRRGGYAVYSRQGGMRTVLSGGGHFLPRSVFAGQVGPGFFTP